MEGKITRYLEGTLKTLRYYKIHQKFNLFFQKIAFTQNSQTSISFAEHIYGRIVFWPLNKNLKFPIQFQFFI